MKRKTMTVKIADKELNNKVVQIALDFLRNSLSRHCNRILNIGNLSRPDLVIHRLRPTPKNSITQPAGYRFTPSHDSGPTSLEAENASGVAAGLIFLGEHFACNGDFPGKIERQPAFDLRLASAVSPLYTPDPEAVRRALRPDGSMQIWDSWTRQIDTEVPPYADESAFEPRLRQFETYADTMVRYGANGIVLNGLSHMIDYKNLSNTPLLSEDHKTRMRHQIYHDFFKKIFSMVKDRDLLLIVISDQFSYLKEIEDWIGPVNAENPRVWQTLYSGITEAFERFPEIDGLMTRYGQHDATQEYRSEDIFHSPGKPVDTHTWGDYTNRPHDIKTLAKLIETVTEASRRRGKLSLFRTWTQTEIDLHSRKDLFQRLVETLPAEIRQNTIFSIKRTLTDFWYHQPVNPTLSCQGSERMIEFECRHEFEGMGIFPAYWGKDSKEAVKYAIRQGVKHMWFWPDAGGWVTPNYPVILPYVSGFDFWIDANVFQIYRLIWDPEESDEKTALDFGTLALGCEAGEGVAKILQMSYEACSRIFYTLPFAKRVEWKTISPCWHMPWLGVDPREIERVLDTTGESVAELLEESAEGVEWAIKLEREVLRLSANSGADQATLEQMRNSAFHLRKFAELMHAFRNLFCSREENIKEVQENILRLRDCLGQYKSESNMVITEGFEKYLEQVESKVRRT